MGYVGDRLSLVERESIIKYCELKIGKLDKNSVFNIFGPEFDIFFEMKHYCMRYGIGMEKPGKVFDIILGDNHA